MKNNNYIFIFIFIIFLIIIGLIILYFCIHNNKTPHQLFFTKYYGDIYYNENIDSKVLDKIKNEKILFMIPAFNCNISKLKNRIKYLVQGFKKYKIFIYGLDSTNLETIQELKEWKNTDFNNIYLIPINENISKDLSRTERIALIRNSILNYIKNLNLDDNWKAISYDSDHKGPMSKLGLVDSILRLNGNKEIYSICTSGTNSLFPGFHFLYDSYAYRDINNKKFKIKMHYLLDDYNKIISGYSGASIYRFKDLKNIEYPLNKDTCEHIGLHNILKEYYDNKYKKSCYMEMSKLWHIYIGLQPSIH